MENQTSVIRNSIEEYERLSQIPIVNMSQFEQVLKFHIKTVTVPLLVLGQPGIGKSAATREVARALGSTLIPFNDPEFGKEKYGYIDLRLGYLDPTDFKGFPYIDTKEGFSTWLASGWLPTEKNIKAGRVPEFGICCLEELGLANDEVRKNAFQLLQEREINGDKIGDGWTFIATSNRLEDKSGATALAAALVNRFSVIELRPTVADWTVYGRQAKIWEPLLAFFKFKPNHLYSFTPKTWKLNSPFCSPRSAENFSKIVTQWLDDVKPEGKMPVPPAYLMKPLLGVAIAMEFAAFLRVYENIPDPDEVIADPKKAIVPDEPSEMWAITSALVERATRENYEAIDTYLQRFSDDFEIATTREIVTVTNYKVCTLKAYHDHTKRHKSTYASLK